MSPNFIVTGAEALLAIAACERTTGLTGQSETNPGQNVRFGYGAVGRFSPFDVSNDSGSLNTDASLCVQVERLMTRPGVYRYQCIIQPNAIGTLD